MLQEVVHYPVSHIRPRLWSHLPCSIPLVIRCREATLLDSRGWLYMLVNKLFRMVCWVGRRSFDCYDWRLGLRCMLCYLHLRYRRVPVIGRNSLTRDIALDRNRPWTALRAICLIMLV